MSTFRNKLTKKTYEYWESHNDNIEEGKYVKIEDALEVADYADKAKKFLKELYAKPNLSSDILFGIYELIKEDE